MKYALNHKLSYKIIRYRVDCSYFYLMYFKLIVPQINK